MPRRVASGGDARGGRGGDEHRLERLGLLGRELFAVDLGETRPADGGLRDLAHPDVADRTGGVEEGRVDGGDAVVFGVEPGDLDAGRFLKLTATAALGGELELDNAGQVVGAQCGDEAEERSHRIPFHNSHEANMTY